MAARPGRLAQHWCARTFPQPKLAQRVAYTSTHRPTPTHPQTAQSPAAQARAGIGRAGLAAWLPVARPLRRQARADPRSEEEMKVSKPEYQRAAEGDTGCTV